MTIIFGFSITNYSIEDAFKEYLTFLEKDDVLKAFVFAMDLGSKRNQLDYKRKKHPLTFHLVE